MHILLTRPLGDALPTSKRLEQAGHAVTLAPMLEIMPLEARIELEGVQALLFTSANGLRVFAEQCETRDLPAYCVGAATAKAAQDAGFQAVHASGGDVDALAHDITLNLNPAGGALFHAAGSVLAGDLGKMLQAGGYTYRKASLYEARPVERLPEAVATELRDGRIDAVLLYSPRTARLFQERVAEAGLFASLASVTAYCLSRNVAARLQEGAWKKIAVAPRPDQDSLLALPGLEA